MVAFKNADSRSTHLQDVLRRKLCLDGVVYSLKDDLELKISTGFSSYFNGGLMLRIGRDIRHIETPILPQLSHVKEKSEDDVAGGEVTWSYAHDESVSVHWITLTVGFTQYVSQFVWSLKVNPNARQRLKLPSTRINVVKLQTSLIDTIQRGESEDGAFSYKFYLRRSKHCRACGTTNVRQQLQLSRTPTPCSMSNKW